MQLFKVVICEWSGNRINFSNFIKIEGESPGSGATLSEKNQYMFYLCLPYRLHYDTNKQISYDMSFFIFIFEIRFLYLLRNPYYHNC